MGESEGSKKQGKAPGRERTRDIARGKEGKMGMERRHPEQCHKPRAQATRLNLTAGQDSSERPREAKTQRNREGNSRRN